MRQNKERVGSLGDLSMKQLRGYWEEADNTPGEHVMVEGLGSVTKGEVYEELAGRSVRGEIKQPRKSRISRPRRTFHPIDGSWGMMEQSKRGAVMARSRR